MMRYERDREYYFWEVNDFYDVTQKLRVLASRIKDDVPSNEDVDIRISEYIDELVQRQNRIFRAVAREIRELHKQLKRG